MLTTLAARPPGLARAAAATEQEKSDAQFVKDVAAREAQQRISTQHARNLKIERLARTNSLVRALLEEHTALQASVKELRANHAALEQKHAGHLVCANELATENASLQQTLNGTTANLETAQQQFQQLGRELDAARAETARVREEHKAALAALKPKGK